MPLHCPRCGIAQAEENETCINCGQPLRPAPAAPGATLAGLLAEADAAAHLADHDDPAASDSVHAVQARRASWRLPALIAVGLLLALLASALLVARRRPPLQTVAPAPSPDLASPVPTAPTLPAVPASPEAGTKPIVAAKTVPKTAAKTPAAKTVGEAAPLTVTLASQSAGRHVSVGDSVTLTAVTAPAQGRSVTLTLFSRRGRGEKTMLSFVEGSLCSTTWTPAVPGRYEFTATAQGDRRQSATSRRVEITVDRPAPQTVAQYRPVHAPPVAPVLPLPRTVRLPPPKPLRPTPAPPRAARAPRPVPIYHVAAAQFAFSRSAVVLADALRQRGYPALPERMTNGHGKTVYVVVTGSFRRPKEARSAVLALQRSGYPAYLFSGR